MEGCPILSTRFQSYPLAFHRKTLSVDGSNRFQSYPNLFDRKTGSVDLCSSTNGGDRSVSFRFRWKNPCSICGILRESSAILDSRV